MTGPRVEHRQRDHRVRLEWGLAGVELLAVDCAVVVIVDVLSFCTAVDIAAGRGAAVLPQRWVIRSPPTTRPHDTARSPRGLATGTARRCGRRR